MLKKPKFLKTKVLAYLGLVFVILFWGMTPLITLEFYKYYSPTIKIAFASLVSTIFLFFISLKDLKLINKTYFTTAIPTGLFLSIANVLQKIGLQYTTPTHYAFLENLSVLVVPFLLFLFTKKKPHFFTVSAAILCLISSFVLSGMGADKSEISFLGDMLCALAGIFYGVNIAGTGAFAKKLYAPLYIMIQMFISFLVSLIAAIVFDITKIEKIKFDFDWRLIIASIVLAFVSSTFCWLIRTWAMRYVGASVVAILMPFSSIVTTVLSIIVGTDTLTINLVIGVILGLIAVFLSSFGDKKQEKAKVKKTIIKKSEVKV